MDRLLKYLIWPPVWLFVQIIRLLGVDNITTVARFNRSGKAVARLMRFLLGKRNHYLDDNVALIFPDYSSASREQIKHQYYANMLITAAESICMDGSEFMRTRFVGTEYLRAAKEHSRGILFVSGHFNNWEINRRNIEALGFPGWELYRDFSSTRFNYLDINRKYRLGQHMLTTREIPTFISRLKEGDNAHMLVDVKIKEGRNGVQVDFAGQPAWTSVFAAEMAVTHQLQVIATFTERDGRGGYIQTFQPISPAVSGATPVPPIDGDTPDITEMSIREQAVELTREINQTLTQQLQSDPASWLLWDTNRWGA